MAIILPEFLDACSQSVMDYSWRNSPDGNNAPTKAILQTPTILRTVRRDRIKEWRDFPKRR